MSKKASLTRDQQVHLMQGAGNRHEANVARWKQDPEVRVLLRKGGDAPAREADQDFTPERLDVNPRDVDFQQST